MACPHQEWALANLNETCFSSGAQVRLTGKLQPCTPQAHSPSQEPGVGARAPWTRGPVEGDGAAPRGWLAPSREAKGKTGSGPCRSTQWNPVGPGGKTRQAGLAEGGAFLRSALHLQQNCADTLACGAHRVRAAVALQRFPAPAQPPPPERRAMCCDRCLGGTSVISTLGAQALAGHGSHPDARLVSPWARGGLQPTGQPQPPARPRVGV